ncbi:hypothetical protein N8791_06645 [Gammaproteobacteria bacterium]|nr:hypothetical protein [Gammaproteobacteria bacterium]
MKKQFVIIALYSLSLNLMTASLGSMSVSSSVNENLQANIVVNNDSDLKVSDIRVEKSQKEFIKSAKMLDVSELIISISANTNGGQSIRLTTSEPVKSQHYDFNIIIETRNSIVSKRYYGFIPKVKSLDKTSKTEGPKVAVNDLSSCLDLIDSQARLDCYDKSLSRNKDTDQQSKVLISSQKGKATVAEKVVEEDYFGKRGEDLQESIAKTQRVIIPNEMSTAVEKITRYAPDKYILTLKNGQKWKILEPTRKGLFKKDQTVSITKGLFGSYNLNISSQNTKYKVKREK